MAGIESIKGIGYDDRHDVSFANKKKLEKDLLPNVLSGTAPQVAFVPQGGIGELLRNGQTTQPSQTAVQA